MKPVCVVIAGGRSSRMGGGQKGLLPLGGMPMLAHVLAAVTPQVHAILINSNANPQLFEPYRLPVLADSAPGQLGPLAGLLTGMLWARQNHPSTTHLLSAPCDSPCLPSDLVARLTGALTKSGKAIAIARDKERLHPTLGLWPVALAERLADDLVRHDMRGMQAWLRQFAVQEVFFDPDDLRNINTPEDLAALRSQPPRHVSASAWS
jgi:molybdopterin-guanine dinucleotide biosynthesis protein A